MRFPRRKISVVYTPRKVGRGVGLVPEGAMPSVEVQGLQWGGRAGITLRQPERFRFTGSFAGKPALALQEAYMSPTAIIERRPPAHRKPPSFANTVPVLSRNAARYMSG